MQLKIYTVNNSYNEALILLLLCHTFYFSTYINNKLSWEVEQYITNEKLALERYTKLSKNNIHN